MCLKAKYLTNMFLSYFSCIYFKYKHKTVFKKKVENAYNSTIS